MTEGLLRQRRNLFITCVLLWFMKYGGVRLHKISLAGFDVELARPEVMTLALWIAFTYFLYRYYQYFTSEGLSKLESEYSRSLEARCTPLIQGRVIAAYPRVQHSDFRYFILKQNGWMFKGQQVVLGPDGKTPISQPIELPISRWAIRRGVAVAFIESTFRSSVATDYLLPFALAGFVLWYCGSADWSGSFLHLIFES
ncbi:MAG TPA: hypothetical protein VN283_11915 [Thiobacillus sp.]|nr:hypothetical protein [Thiobacillus sp.]